MLQILLIGDNNDEISCYPFSSEEAAKIESGHDSPYKDGWCRYQLHSPWKETLNNFSLECVKAKEQRRQQIVKIFYLNKVTGAGVFLSARNIIFNQVDTTM